MTFKKPCLRRLITVWFTWAFYVSVTAASSYDQWWNYEGVSGPNYWGAQHWEWRPCGKGLHQSPINIDPRTLTYDPNLEKVFVNVNSASGILENTGQFLKLTLDEKAQYPVSISGGPLGMYNYRLHQIIFHFGLTDRDGSEHSIDGQKFLGEVQLYAFNTDLYSNFSEAAKLPHGIVAIAAVMDKSSNDLKTSDSEINLLANATTKVLYRGLKVSIPSFTPHKLLPASDHYVSYEGSFTYPGCYESVTWVVLNKPLYISQTDLNKFRDAQATERKLDEPQFLANNYRPLAHPHKRVLLTNINFSYKVSTCKDRMAPVMYTANPRRKNEHYDRRTRSEYDSSRRLFP